MKLRIVDQTDIYGMMKSVVFPIERDKNDTWRCRMFDLYDSPWQLAFDGFTFEESIDFFKQATINCSPAVLFEGSKITRPTVDEYMKAGMMFSSFLHTYNKKRDNFTHNSEKSLSL